MAWAKVDDGWWAHPKVLALSLASRGVWVTALSWSCAQRKDTVPTALLTMVGGSKTEAKELVEAGLWIAAEDGWRIHDWAEYQDRTLSDKRADAGRKGGIKSGEARRAAANEATPGSNSEANAEAGTHPFPSLPNQETPARRAVTAPDLLPVTDAMRSWAVNAGIRSDALDSETAAFLDWHRSKGTKHKDWTAAWRTWMRKAVTFRPEITQTATTDRLGPQETYR